MNTIDDLPRTEAAIVRSLIAPREMQVWRLRAEGFSIKEIAGQQDCSTKTIECQLASLHKKLKARGQADLVRLAVRYGVITVEVLA